MSVCGVICFDDVIVCVTCHVTDMSCDVFMKSCVPISDGHSEDGRGTGM